MVITWNGPLDITPLGYRENPIKKRYTVRGEGPAMVLKDAQATAYCSRFEFHNPQQAGMIEGAPGMAVPRLVTANGEIITCPRMSFTGAGIDAQGRRREALAVLTGRER